MSPTQSGFLPFTTQQFFDVMARYNQDIWPLQVGFNLLALAMLWTAFRPKPYSNNFISGGLGLLWIWMGIAYHWMYFSAINKAALGFGLVFVIQGALLAGYGILGKRLSFRYVHGTYGIVGAVLIAYALIVYPLLGWGLGHAYPNMPTFGLPCPTTIFTFGLLCWADRQVPRIFFVIPLLWAAIGSSAAILLGVREDLGLLVAGLVGVTLLFRKWNPA